MNLTRVSKIWCLVLTVASVALASGPEITFVPGGEPIQHGRSVPLKLTRTAPAVVLPYFYVDLADTEGPTTFFAVRNGTDEEIIVRYRYYAVDAGPLQPTVTETLKLSDHGVRVVDMRSINGLSATKGIATGYMLAEHVDASGLVVPDSTALSGDYFRLDVGNAFASGGELLAIGPLNLAFDLCQQWDARFFNGGGFDGGTEMTFYLVKPPGSVTIGGNVYNQAGDLQGTVSVMTSDYAFAVNSLELDLPVNFGAIEWQMPEGVVGHVSATFNASGLYSVGVAAVCADTVDDLAAMSLESLAAEAVAATSTAAAASFATTVLTMTGVLLDYDDETGTWIASIELDTGHSAELRLQLRDFMGNPQTNYDPILTGSVRVEGEASGPNGELHFEILLTSLVGTTFEVNGSGSATYQGTSAGVTVENLVVSKTPGQYPESGTITVIVQGATVVAEFNGSRFVTATVTYLGQTYTFTIDLATGTVVLT